MKEEKNEKKQENKIISFEVKDEVLEDPEIDRLVRESLIREADELEAELNGDPRLKGAGVSDELFQSIVEELKEQGVWEEEPGAERAEGTARSPEAENGRSEGADRSPEAENGRSEGAARSPEAENGSTKGTARSPEMVKQSRGMSREAGPEKESTGVREAVPEFRTPQEVYDLLSQEDRRRLELGREAERKLQKKAARRQRRRRVLGYSGTVAAGLALVFGISMTSEANRRLVQKAWELVTYNFNFRVQTDYTGDNEQIRSKSKEEVEALEDIRQRLGIAVIDFAKLPKGMEYMDYDILTDMMEAVIHYIYQDKIFTITITNLKVEGSNYYMMDQEAELLETITTAQDFEAKIWETNQELPEEERAYFAEIEHKDCRYILNGMISLEEMEEIIKSTYIL